MLNFSQITKHEEYKQLCIASYKPFEYNNSCQYNLIAAIPGNNGFFACVYKKDNEMVIVFRGTEASDIRDIKNDIQMLKNKIPSQAQNAIEVFDRFNTLCKDLGLKLTVTGHSLGGSLAAIVGAMKGVETVTFNAYGIRQLLNPNIKYFTDNIINYCNKYDPITKIKAKYHMGKCYTIKSKDFFKSPHSLENMDSLYEREETPGVSLQDDFDKEEHSKKEFEEYKKYGKHIIRMPGLYSDINKSGCTGSYPVNGYTREDGIKVGGYIRTCYKHKY